MNDTLNPYVQTLVDLYKQHSDTGFAEWSEKYFRKHFEFIGIRTPIRRRVTNQFIKENGLPSKDQLKEIIFSLWSLPEREYQHAALDILKKVKKELTASDMPWLKTLILEKSWWDTVDVLAPQIFGYIFSNDDELIDIYAEQWIEDENIWLNRSVILYQLLYKNRTDEARLFRYILKKADSEAFFVQKSIGWALREYAKSQPGAVKSFVSENTLKPLSRREALKHFS